MSRPRCSTLPTISARVRASPNRKCKAKCRRRAGWSHDLCIPPFTTRRTASSSRRCSWLASSREWDRSPAASPTAPARPARRCAPALECGDSSQRHGQPELCRDRGEIRRQPAVDRTERLHARIEFPERSHSHHFAGAEVEENRPVVETVEEEFQLLIHLVFNRPLRRKLVEVEIELPVDPGDQEVESRNENLASVDIDGLLNAAVTESPFEIDLLRDRQIEVHVQRGLPAAVELLAPPCRQQKHFQRRRGNKPFLAVVPEVDFQVEIERAETGRRL